ncbi:hypothetical protein EVAR_803_1 [Eumeta japonica]|uniref:Uncharacterized protein n=1 Tax=Eumeta variegata TaxID=151549 RepID=A0A4C1SF27_EUMVA|nr:hypothetical protein EVAR_803_1 [Eumeta japonica]
MVPIIQASFLDQTVLCIYVRRYYYNTSWPGRGCSAPSCGRLVHAVSARSSASMDVEKNPSSFVSIDIDLNPGYSFDSDPIPIIVFDPGPVLNLGFGPALDSHTGPVPLSIQIQLAVTVPIRMTPGAINISLNFLR